MLVFGNGKDPKLSGGVFPSGYSQDSWQFQGFADIDREYSSIMVRTSEDSPDYLSREPDIISIFCLASYLPVTIY